MTLPSKRSVASSLRGFGRKVPLKVIASLQPFFLLQMLVGFSQILNGGAAQSEALARDLILDGQQRLRALRDARAHLDLPLHQLRALIWSNQTNNEDLSAEEDAVQALLEMCLGLILEWLWRLYRQSYPSPLASGPTLCFGANGLFLPYCSFLIILPPRARACPSLRLAGSV